MEEPENETPEVDPNVCANCGNPAIESGYQVNLCSDCRNKLSRFPVPRWITISVTILIALMLIGLYSLPKYLSASIHYKRGVNAEEQKKFVKSQREFEEVIGSFPDWTEANAHLFLAQCSNEDIREAVTTFQVIDGRTSEDVDLSNKVNSAMDNISRYYVIQDSIVSATLDSIPADSSELFVHVLSNYIRENNNDPAAKYILADKLYDMEQYNVSARLMEDVTNADRENMLAWNLLGASYRELKRFDESLNCYNQILYLNNENVYAMVGKAKVKYKQFKDEEGLQIAKEAVMLNPEDYSAYGALSLGYFLMNMQNEFREAYQKFQSLEPDSVTMRKMDEVVNGLKPYR